MNFINLNGQLFPIDTPIYTADSRLARYGDGLFESIRMFDGKLPFLSYHFKRLMTGLDLLQIDPAKAFSKLFFQNEIEKLCGNKGNWRIRLSIFREKGGLYTPINNNAIFLIEASPLEISNFKLNRKQLKLGVYKDNQLPCSPLSNIKSSNSLIYILANKFVKSSTYDACLILNSKGRIAEANHSNLFLIQENTLITPALKEACIAGTMREIILEIANQNGFKIKERNVPLQLLFQCDEIFLTNAIKGIQWIAAFEEKNYSKSKTSQLLKQLNQLVANG